MANKNRIWDWLHDGDADLSGIFDGVAPELLAKIKPEMVQTFQHGDLLVQQGNNAESFTVLLHGEVSIVRRADGCQAELATRYAPALIGEQAFIEDREHSADVVARRLVRALVLPCPLVRELLRDSAFACHVMRHLSCKLRESTMDRGWRYAAEHRLMTEFRSHLSATALNRLVQTGADYGSPRTINAVILFSDIRGFTSLTAQMTPAEVANQLGPYLDDIVAVIQQHGGLVDKFIGDAVMAIWGYAPDVEGALDTGRVLQCAQAMLATAGRHTLKGQHIEIGIGLNAGQVFSGNIGSAGKRQWTVLGEPVNLASRFESACKALGTPLVAGQAFVDILEPTQHGLLIPHYNQAIKGAENQTLYTLAANTSN